MKKKLYRTSSPEETKAVAAALAARTRPGSVYALHGALGAGKTVLFVTEKASARSIIMDNLKRCKTSDTKGLTDFVLDFESFRTRGGAIGREPFVRELNRCLNLRAQLSADSAGLLYDEGERYRAIETFMRQARSIYGEKNYLSLLDGMAPFSSMSLN